MVAERGRNPTCSARLCFSAEPFSVIIRNNLGEAWLALRGGRSERVLSVTPEAGADFAAPQRGSTSPSVGLLSRRPFAKRHPAPSLCLAQPSRACSSPFTSPSMRGDWPGRRRSNVGSSRGRPLRPIIREAFADLTEAYRALAAAGRAGEPLTPAAEWLLDNYYVVRDQLREAEEAMPASLLPAPAEAGRWARTRGFHASTNLPRRSRS